MISDLIIKLDEAFSRYIRLRYADDNGYVTCVTCGRRLHYKEAQCGHFIPRRHLATRFHKVNGQVQCENCNCYLEGNLDRYREYLEFNYPDELIQLYKLKHQIVKYTRSELISLIKLYNIKVKDLQN